MHLQIRDPLGQGISSIHISPFTTGIASMASSLLSSLERDGFVVIPSILSPEELSLLRNASSDTISLARSGKWPHVRTLPKQFPPWGPNPFASTSPSPNDTSDTSLNGNPKASAPGIWGIQHLLSPSLPSSPTFTKSYFSPAVLGTAKDLLSTPSTPCTDADLVLELFNLLIRPDADFQLRWHRDDIPFTCTLDDETARLARPAWHAQWNLALYDDASLVVVPGSHARARTAAESAVLAVDLYGVLPGQQTVELKAGDAVFYNNNIIHRGTYDSGVERMTLHGSVGHVRGSDSRARNVLQHGVGAWVEKCDFSCLGDVGGEERERAEGMRRRLVEMGRGKGEVGFSLDG